jgi:hypothetical protein
VDADSTEAVCMGGRGASVVGTGGGGASVVGICMSNSSSLNCSVVSSVRGVEAEGEDEDEGEGGSSEGGSGGVAGRVVEAASDGVESVD